MAMASLQTPPARRRRMGPAKQEEMGGPRQRFLWQKFFQCLGLKGPKNKNSRGGYVLTTSGLVTLHTTGNNGAVLRNCLRPGEKNFIVTIEIPQS